MKDDLIFKKFQIFYQKKYRAKKSCSNREDFKERYFFIF
jgi:hypothetical protein